MTKLVHLTTVDSSLAILLGPQLRAFAAHGYDVIGVSAPGPYVAELESWGIGHIALRHATRAMRPHRDALALAELRQLFRRVRPDIVHTHNPKTGLYGRVAARMASVPAIVHTTHGLYATEDDSRAKRALVYRLERWAARCSDVELVQNPEDVAVMQGFGIPPEKLRLLGNGIDLARFDRARVADVDVARARAAMGASADDVVCGVVGRLVWEKGYREIFAAAEQLRARTPSVRVVVVGPRDFAKADAIPAADLARAERSGVRFLDDRQDMEAQYAAMDLYALASYREGFPRSAMEAAAMGLPVVATNIRGCRQVVDDETTGVLFPRGDATALANAISRLASDARLRMRMGDAGRAKARREFDDRAVIDLTLAVYRELLTRRGQGVR